MLTYLGVNSSDISVFYTHPREKCIGNKQVVIHTFYNIGLMFPFTEDCN